MFRFRDIAFSGKMSAVDGNTITNAVENLYLFRIRMDNNTLPVIAVRNGIIKTIIGDMIIIRNLTYKDSGKGIKPVFWQRVQCRFVQSKEIALS